MKTAAPIRSNFVPCRRGFVPCPKCFGETEIVLTARDAEGWPLGPLERRMCDHCDGMGDVLPINAERPIAAPTGSPGDPGPNVGSPVPSSGWTTTLPT